MAIQLKLEAEEFEHSSDGSDEEDDENDKCGVFIQGLLSALSILDSEVANAELRTAQQWFAAMKLTPK
jgi:hypothetical protein